MTHQSDSKEARALHFLRHLLLSFLLPSEEKEGGDPYTAARHVSGEVRVSLNFFFEEIISSSQIFPLFIYRREKP